MKAKSTLTLISVSAFAVAATVARAQDPLPSWNDGPAKKSIVAFVAKVTKKGSPDFVPPAERIATFDNDGTLWTEQPMYFQLLFAFDRVKTLAPQHPEWNDKEPFASLFKGDVKTALAGGAEVPKDRPIDGVDQLDFFLGKQETSNREGIPAYVTDRLSAVKWGNWKAHLIWQENMYDPPVTLPLPKVINLLSDLKEERDVAAKNSWVIDPVVRIIGEFEASLKKYPPIPMGTPDPYTPPKQ